MSEPCNVILKRGETERIAAGHPWIHARSVDRLTRTANDGDVVQAKDHRNRFLGIGFYNSKSKIQIRLLGRQRRPIDRAFFHQRIEAAVNHRQRVMPDAQAFRAVNSESDFLSGLIIDKYGDAVVLQTSSLGMDLRKNDILPAIRTLLNPSVIIERNDMGARKFEGLEDLNGVLEGNLDGPVTIKLNGLDFEIDLLGGHKTGAYLDQQVNYQAVADLIATYPGANVVDCFTFHGGFALHAARAGAKKVLGLDQSAEVLAVAKKNTQANGLTGSCSFEEANVFDWLKAQTANKGAEPYDCIILDPPSFTRNRASVNDALRGYKEIHVRAMKLLKPGGLLATFCCSHHVDAQLFHAVAMDAAFDTRRQLRRVATFSQSPDHPIIPAIQETEYLKGFAFQVLKP
jgi:23S rRNA (cytosine1962-C5)-methyltransferase